MNTVKTTLTPSVHSIDVVINQNLKLNNQSVNFIEYQGKIQISLLSLLDIYHQSIYYSLERLQPLLECVESESRVEVQDDIFLPDYSLIWLFNQLDNVLMSKIIFKVISRLKFSFEEKKALECKIQGVVNRCFVS